MSRCRTILDPICSADMMQPEEIAVSLDDLTDTERYLLVRALSAPGDNVNLPYAVNCALQRAESRGLTRHAVEVRYYRAADRLSNRGLATVEKRSDSLIWLTADRVAVGRMIDADRRRMRAPPANDINLIRGTCEFQTRPNRVKKYDPLATPSNASNPRLEAIKYLQGARPLLGPVDRARINRLFATYSDETSQKIIALIERDSGEIIGSQYSTRFNDTKKAAVSLTKYDLAIQKSFLEHKRAVFVTLTIDPSRFGSNYIANRSFGTAWNRFLSRLQKRLGYRPQYISAFEFTKKGLLHCHALIFLEYLMDQKVLSDVWSTSGLGRIVYLYGLKAVPRPEGGWTWKWLKRRPARCKAANAADYIAKYLKKSLLAMSDSYGDPADIQSLYWALNKRFWTSSRALLPTPEELASYRGETFVSKEPTEPRFSFYGVFHEDESSIIDRMVYWRGGAAEGVG